MASNLRQVEGWGGARPLSAVCGVPVEPVMAGFRVGLLAQISLLLNEAVANAVRHGSAGRTGVRVTAEDYCLGVVIANDGRPRLAGSPSRRERVATLGGKLKLHDRADHMRLKFELPL